MRKLLFYRTLPHFVFEWLERYFRVEVEGEEHLPRSGGAILLPNHSGFLGLDALILSHWICKSQGRIPRIMLHRLWFKGGLLRSAARSLGFVEASYKEGRATLERKKLLMLFPEGEEGNFKPTGERYRLKPFRQGFAKMAAELGVPVIPVLIIGAEESNITVAQVKFFDQLLPLPFNFVPLPAKWKIRFLPPIQVSDSIGPIKNAEIAASVADKIRVEMQSALSSEVTKRKYVFFQKTKSRTFPAKSETLNNIFL